MSPKFTHLLPLLWLTACTAQSSPKPQLDAGIDLPRPQPEIVPSARKKLKRIDGKRFAQRLAAGLAIPEQQLCQELGRFDCVQEAHLISMGGVEPYLKTIYTPLEVAPISAPLAFERTALAACNYRVEKELAGEIASLFGLKADTKLSPEKRKTVVQHLFQGLMGRAMGDQELSKLEQYYQKLEQDSSEDLDARWTTLSCFAIATSVETLFY